MKILLLMLTIMVFCIAVEAEEKLQNFNLENKDNILLNNQALKEGQCYLIAIFPDKCFPCNKNRFLLDKLSQFNNLTTYGVFMNQEHYYNFHNVNLVAFTTYFPLDLKGFIEGTGIDPRKTYTILTKGCRVLYRKSGNIHFKEFKEMKRVLRIHNEKNNSVNNEHVTIN